MYVQYEALDYACIKVLRIPWLIPVSHFMVAHLSVKSYSIVTRLKLLWCMLHVDAHDFCMHFNKILRDAFSSFIYNHVLSLQCDLK